MIDWKQAQVLCDEVGASEFEEVVELFLEEVYSTVNKLRSGRDNSTLEHDMHFLKGSALSLGFAEFSKLCQSAEHMSSAGQAEAVEITPILDCYDASRAIFLSEMNHKLSA